MINRPAAHALLKGKTGDVAEYAAKQVLAEYGIAVTQEQLATSRDAAVAAAQKIGRLTSRTRPKPRRYSWAWRMLRALLRPMMKS